MDHVKSASIEDIIKSFYHCAFECSTLHSLQIVKWIEVENKVIYSLFVRWYVVVLFFRCVSSCSYFNLLVCVCARTHVHSLCFFGSINAYLCKVGFSFCAKMQRANEYINTSVLIHEGEKWSQHTLSAIQPTNIHCIWCCTAALKRHTHIRIIPSRTKKTIKT